MLNGANPAAPVLEDSAVNPGTLVADLIANQATDANGVLGIAVTGVDSSNGSWEWTTDGWRHWFNLDTASATAARLLGVDGQTRVRFVADPNWNGTAAIDFRAWDQSIGSLGAWQTSRSTAVARLSALARPRRWSR